MAGELTCSAKFSKTILFICNLVIALAGIALFALGIWFVSAPNSVHLFHITDSSSLLNLIRAAGGIIIGVGLLVMVVGTLGCCGAIRQKTGCLDCFTALLIIFVVLQIVATILAGVFHTQITNTLTDAMNKTIQTEYGNDNDTWATNSWDIVQHEFQCCGVKSYADWRSSEWKMKHADAEVPNSCCKLVSDDPSSQPRNITVCYEEARTGGDTELYRKGCEDKLDSWLTSYWGVLIGVVVAVIIIEVAGIVLSCCLISGIKKGYEYV